jgi:hypothetical protein
VPRAREPCRRAGHEAGARARTGACEGAAEGTAEGAGARGRAGSPGAALTGEGRAEPRRG